ncbi:MAG: hypothetical protein LBI66_11350 [Burkholderiaceae bacterium]|jgi:hypothetical protein|nr:hypothetical protein [Burkholderiaceae bacterium]
MQHIATLRAMPATPRASILPLALQAAIAARRTEQLHDLLLQHGPHLFAHAVEALTPRQQADILSLLAPQQRAEVYRHLAPAARRQWLQSATVARQPLTRRLLGTCQRNWHWLLSSLGLVRH